MRVTSAENAPAPILIDTYSPAKAFAPSTGDNIIFYVAILITCLIIIGFVLSFRAMIKYNKGIF